MPSPRRSTRRKTKTKEGEQYRKGLVTQARRNKTKTDLKNLVKNLSMFNVTLKGKKRAVLSQKYNRGSLDDISDLLSGFSLSKKSKSKKSKSKKSRGNPIKSVANNTRRVAKRMLKKNDFFQKQRLARHNIFANNRAKMKQQQRIRDTAPASPKFKFSSSRLL